MDFRRVAFVPLGQGFSTVVRGAASSRRAPQKDGTATAHWMRPIRAVGWRRRRGLLRQRMQHSGEIHDECVGAWLMSVQLGRMSCW